MKISGAQIFNDIDTAYTKAKKLGREIYCIGGASIYQQAMPLAQKMYLSWIKQDYQGDVYFPEFNPEDWEIEESQDHPDFEFRIYRRK
jgi:dihydrofolate reductase